MFERVISAAVLLCVVGQSYGKQVGTVRTVALTNERAAGQGLNVVYDRFDSGSVRINETGDVAFWASLNGRGVNGLNNTAIFTRGVGGPAEAVLRAGSASPAGSSDVVSEIRSQWIEFNGAGQIIFDTRVLVEGVEETIAPDYMLHDPEEGLVRVVRTQDATPIAPSIRFQNLLLPILSDSGRVIFGAALSGGGSVDSGVFSYEQGKDIETIARGAAALPGTGITASGLRLHGHNNTAGTLISAALNNNRDGVFLIGTDGVTRTVVREDRQAPGEAEGVTLRSLDSTPIVLGDGGHVLYIGTTSLDTNSSVLYSGRDAESIRAIARTGAQAPGTTLGTVFEDLVTSTGGIGLNARGDVGFLAELGGVGINNSNRNALYLDTGAGPELIARDGDAIVVDGVLRTMARISFGDRIAINDQGALAFLGSLSGGLESLLAMTPNGEFITVAERGQFFDVNDDPDITRLRQVTGFGDEFTINSSGELVFVLEFSSGSESGIFTVQVPAPSALWLMAMSGVFAVRRCRD